ncbi:electron transport complex subunit RsxG [Luminiphilus sp. nBUS_07]|uniref:electron transport complex subunit RsxG n=1 Tax=Luminiphilus sp. nBUS_07 TaxID=3395314 RepID=UPI003EB9B274
MKAAVAISRSALFLGIFAALAAALIAWTWATTKTDIERSIREAEARQLLEIFPANTHNNSLIDDRFTLEANTPLLELRSERSGYTVRIDETVVGVILPATARDGYSGDIELLVGVTADGEIAGARVVSHKETPGLGDGIDTRKSPWILSFDGRSLRSPLQPEWSVKKDGGAFDQFTGATVTPRAVVAAIRRTLEYQALHRDRLFEVDPTHNTAVETGP